MWGPLSIGVAGLFVVAAHSQSAQLYRGTICGTVQDENGAPAKAVLIGAFESNRTGPMPATRTDAQGHYCFRNLHLGLYAMSANDPAKDYPDLGATLYGAHHPVDRVKIDEAHPVATSSWRIPYKAAILHVQFSNANTGLPITPASMTVSMAARSDPEKRWIRDSSDATKKCLVPPDEDIYLSVSVPGYKAWPEDGSKGAVVNYAPGSSNTLNVKLRPRATR